MAEVAYLLGAGASAQCLPVVKNMATDITDLIDRLCRHNLFSIKENPESDHQEKADLLQRVKRVLYDLQSICEYHSSIDTYAKKLYLQGGSTNAKFLDLKRDLSFYFTLVQLLNDPDKRYDNFWASILQNKDRLPSRINIISWNYDFQLEMTYKDIIGLDTITAADKRLQLKCPNLIFQDPSPDCFNYYKLNGTAKYCKYTYSENPRYFSEDPYKDPDYALSECINEYFRFCGSSRDFSSSLKFAWEEENRASLIAMMEPLLREIEILVVIGYSFPYFNRAIDEEIFKRMLKLEKVYIQDTDPQGIKEIIEQLPGINFEASDYTKVEHKLIYNVDQFVFPKELELI